LPSSSSGQIPKSRAAPYQRKGTPVQKRRESQVQLRPGAKSIAEAAAATPSQAAVRAERRRSPQPSGENLGRERIEAVNQAFQHTIEQAAKRASASSAEQPPEDQAPDWSPTEEQETAGSAVVLTGWTPSGAKVTYESGPQTKHSRSRSGSQQDVTPNIRRETSESSEESSPDRRRGPHRNPSRAEDQEPSGADQTEEREEQPADIVEATGPRDFSPNQAGGIAERAAVALRSRSEVRARKEIQVDSDSSLPPLSDLTENAEAEVAEPRQIAEPRPRRPTGGGGSVTTSIESATPPVEPEEATDLGTSQTAIGPGSRTGQGQVTPGLDIASGKGNKAVAWHGVQRALDPQEPNKLQAASNRQRQFLRGQGQPEKPHRKQESQTCHIPSSARC
jgi:hypothetical protein